MPENYPPAAPDSRARIEMKPFTAVAQDLIKADVPHDKIMPLLEAAAETALHLMPMLLVKSGEFGIGISGVRYIDFEQPMGLGFAYPDLEVFTPQFIADVRATCKAELDLALAEQPGFFDSPKPGP